MEWKVKKTMYLIDLAPLRRMYETELQMISHLEEIKMHLFQWVETHSV